jgi:hypothetical protein
VSLRTLQRYAASGNAPRAVYLALWFESRWGMVALHAQAFNEARHARAWVASLGVHLISVQKVTHRALSIGAGFARSTHASPCRRMSFCYPSRGATRRLNVGSTSATGPCFACSL